MARSILFHGVGKPLELVETPTPKPIGTEIRVDVTYCTLCRSDLHTYTGARTEPTPLILGHEIVGRISEFGQDALRVDATGQPLNIGDRITWAVVVGCRDCFFCENDLPQKCVSLKKYGHTQTTPHTPNGGGLADTLILAPNTVVYRLSDNLSDRIAAPANCSTATVAALLRVAKTGYTSVGIMGAGLLGLIACAMFNALGIPQIIACDPDESCREQAKRFGATHTLNPNYSDWLEKAKGLTHGYGVDLVLELAGVAASVANSVELVRIGGQLILAGTVSPVQGKGLDPEKIVRKCVSVTGMHNYHPLDLRTALSFLEAHQNRYPFESLVGPEYPLEETETAFRTAQTLRGKRVAIRPVIAWN